MKALLLSVLVLITSPAFADLPVRSQGTGVTLEEAKNNAFKSAVEIKVGSAIVSEQEMSGNKLRDDIVNYSAGYVDKFEIVKQFQTDKGYNVTVDVWVSSSKIQNRILGVSKSPTKINGERYSTQYATYMKGKRDGDRVMDQLLRDYPNRAYVINVGEHRLRVDVFRNGIIEVPIEMRWNYNYVAAMNEVLGLLEDGSNGFLEQSPGNVVTMVKNPDDFMFGKKSHFRFNDVLLTDKIRQTMITKEPVLRLEIRDRANEPVYVACFRPDSMRGFKEPFYSTGNTLIVYGNNVEKSKIQVSFPEEAIPALRNIWEIKVTVVSDENCR